MRIKVQFHGVLAERIGTAEAVFALRSGSSFADLIAVFGRRCSKKVPEQLWDEGNDCFVKDVWAMRGNKRMGDPKEPLKDGEIIRFVLMVTGHEKGGLK